MAITFNLNDDLVRRAEALAHQQGRTLAALVEEYLRNVVARPAPEVPANLSGPVQSLFGVLTLPADFDYKTQRDAA